MLFICLILCHFFLFLPSIFPSIRVFSSESALLYQVAKVLELQHQSNEYSGLISFRINWFDLLAIQGTLKSLLQHHNSKASILGGSAFFMVQFSYPYMTTGKTIALTIQTFFGSSDFMATVSIFSNFGAQENKICHYFHFFPICLP